ncbi:MULTISPECIES: HAD-IIB family hydrolase [Staphylococcus]|jgi:hypothetical protein|uniref:HAD-IIB family hydrolase n=1 Tax=Staphylococcus TaxID=1279 RepID=UPI00298F35C8|nr:MULTISPECIES: HAD-IIB family hydrolase [Staphylococcus]MDW8544621.1 HAD-IIB family hydrolase [Staphylococcus pseudoxylosus]MDW8570031.1 HAD-IIB family hydrolase [Staphylococcus shinii]MDW8574063.1 HAD-IIB family hydrolase [Staphylococcus shinii]
MIIVMDVDGTICFNGISIEEELRNEIHRLTKKHKIIFASARPIRDLLPVIKTFENESLIGGNGSIISTNKVVSVVGNIPKNEFTEIKSIIVENNLEYIIDGSFNYSANVSKENKIFRQLDPDNLAECLGMREIVNPIKIILVGLSNELFSYLKNQLKKYEDKLSINYHETENNIDITAKEINKYTTLKRIIGSQPYIAYGNDINDYELLKYSQKAYYVGNSIKDLPFSNVEQLNSDSKSIVESLRKY